MTRQAIMIGALIIVVIAGIFIYREMTPGGRRSNHIWEFFANPAAHEEWKITTGIRCGEAPFLFPTTGMVGFLWDDSFRLGHHHQGIDIFAGTEAGITGVISAYDGYLTRQSDWKSTVIVRVPNDPLQPGRQIWLYYTHMANREGISYIAADFPPGTHEVFVPAGTLLGYQGDYSGDPNNPTGIHLHFSIVRDDGSGNYLNELEIKNTYDPSPYLGLELNAKNSNGEVPLCQPDSP